MATTKYYNITYDELDAKVEQLYRKIEADNFVPDSMLAVACGGWKPLTFKFPKTGF